MTAVQGLSDSDTAGEKVLIVYQSQDLDFIHGYMKREGESNGGNAAEDVDSKERLQPHLKWWCCILWFHSA